MVENSRKAHRERTRNKLYMRSKVNFTRISYRTSWTKRKEQFD